MLLIMGAAVKVQEACENVTARWSPTQRHTETPPPCAHHRAGAAVFFPMMLWDAVKSDLCVAQLASCLQPAAETEALLELPYVKKVKGRATLEGGASTSLEHWSATCERYLIT